MGQIMDKVKVSSSNIANMVMHRRKRKAEEVENDSDNKENSELAPPKKKKLSTTQYIYQTLFEKQTNSDITVMALGRTWRLHKVYLCQSPYFSSMFNGCWREADQDFVHVKILDERITVDALNAIFGSLYSDEIAIDAKNAVAILATATLFHLESIIDHCSEIMTECLNEDCVIDFYDAACQYGSLSVKKAAFQWLEINLLCVFLWKPEQLRKISVDLMTDLVASPDLYVMQTEFSLYTLLRTWMYLCLHPQYKPNQDIDATKNEETNTAQTAPVVPGGKINSEEIELFFQTRTDGACFLSTLQGQQFIRPFQALRTQYLTTHYMDHKIVQQDNIIPMDWMYKHIASNWRYILKVDHMSEENGPTKVNDQEFLAHSMRCGRVLLNSGFQKWRWTGFNFGLDLVLVCEYGLLSIRRHHRNEHERLLSLRSKRNFVIRATVTCLNEKRQPVFIQKSETLKLSSEKNEEAVIMKLDAKLEYPLLVSVYLLVAPPSCQGFKSKVLTSEEMNSAPISEIGADGDSSIGNDSAICLSRATSSPSLPVAGFMETNNCEGEEFLDACQCNEV